MAPARGRFRFCRICGARLAFAEIGRAGASEEAQARLFAAIQRHLQTSAGCEKAGTFSGEIIAACRCERPVRIAREDGLRCARCEALISPDLAAPPPTAQSPEPSRGAT